MTYPTEAKEGPSPHPHRPAPDELDLWQIGRGDLCTTLLLPFPLSLQKNHCQSEPLYRLSCQGLQTAPTLALSLPSAEYIRIPGSLHPLSGLPKAAPASRRSCRQPRPPPQPAFSPSSRHPSRSRSTSWDDVGSLGGRRSAPPQPQPAAPAAACLAQPPAPPFSKASPPRLTGAI